MTHAGLLTIMLALPSTVVTALMVREAPEGEPAKIIRREREVLLLSSEDGISRQSFEFEVSNLRIIQTSSAIL